MDNISFSVDAGIINRLGKELVGRVETAVSELVKNAYDADANHVELNFINTDNEGGTLIIEDDGTGMNREELINGFMRLSSSDKIHHPVSPVFDRVRAGKKGIGRFATQRLGGKLTIITQKKTTDKALQVNIDWSEYKIDTELSSIQNPITEIEKQKEQGTTLIIDKLGEGWTEAQIKRVFRYVSELLQPDFLSDRSKELTLSGSEETLKIASQQEGTFKVSCLKTANNETISIADEDKMIFEKAVAVYEGFVDKSHDSFCSVKSDRLKIDDIIEIKYDDGNFTLLSDIHFKVYYYIYDRPEYYSSITKSELKRIQELMRINSGIKLYRNGFRVLPYGEKFDDWLKIDAKGGYGSSKTRANIPFRNPNFYGFVELIDTEGILFEETASREGLQENDALSQLQEFVYRSLVACSRRVSEAIAKELEIKRKSKKRKDEKKDVTETLKDIEETVNDFIEGNKNQSEPETEEEKEQQQKKETEFKEHIRSSVEQIKEDIEEKIEKIGMYRVLASLGLTVEMFTHEVQTYNSAFDFMLAALERQNLDPSGKEIAIDLKTNFDTFKSYTAYFNAAASKNESRKIEPIDLQKQVSSFIRIMKEDSVRSQIFFRTEYYDTHEFFTCPMHPAEWQSILLNLYSNSKKAIKRQRKTTKQESGKIKIIVGLEENSIYLEFHDDGDGIAEEYKDRIFNAFFTTSTPASFDAEENEEMSGTGLGLRIVADLIDAYNGNIYVAEPEIKYNTCMRIEIPKVTQQQIEEYGLN